ncbi:molybdopterin-dependent oxidoreductase [Rhodoferax koreense]|nr:molybdopterin-dependent oxidoreductase [Rhodoferax koreense]
MPLGSGPLGAAEAEPGGPVILSVSGKIRGAGPVDFDARALEALGTREIRTRTQWLTAPADWSGVPLDKVLASVGAAGDSLRLRALNDYSVTVPMADVVRFGPILASRLNGKGLSVRDRGPLILIYPFDHFPELNAQVYHDRAVWQLREIVVE